MLWSQSPDWKHKPAFRSASSMYDAVTHFFNLSKSLCFPPLHVFSLRILSWHNRETRHRSFNQNCVGMYCCNNHPLKVEWNCTLWHPEPPILCNYYPHLSTHPLPLSNFWSCEFDVLMVGTGQHTCYVETVALFSPQGAGGWTCRPLLPSTSPCLLQTVLHCFLQWLVTDRIFSSQLYISEIWYLYNDTYCVMILV